MKSIFFLFFFFPIYLLAQKKPLDHTVYDSWQSIGERMISNDGKWVVYTVTPQEGDATLFIRSTDGSNYQKQVPRGYMAMITNDSRFVVFKIKPLFKETREARIKKKKPEELPKDSIGIIELGKEEIKKTAKVKSYKTPEKSFGWLAYQKEKESSRTQTAPTQKAVDSLKKTIDSLVMLVTQIKNEKSGNRDEQDADDDPSNAPASAEGSDLVLRKLTDGKERVFKNVVEYYFNAYGQKLVMSISKSPGDNRTANGVIVYDLKRNLLDTILKGGNDFRNFALTEDGSRIAFLAERDTNTKALQKFYGLYLYRSGDDSAFLLADKKTAGMQLGMTVSENGAVSFSKSGRRLFFGTAPVQPPKDTSLVDFETAKLDIWHYNDDYLQTQQLFQLNSELKRTYPAVYDFTQNKMQQLGSRNLPTIIQTNEGDGETFIALTDTGRRIQTQWTGNTIRDVYAMNVKTGAVTLVKKNLQGPVYPSSTGKYILLYDLKAKNYFAWDGTGLKNISSKIKAPLYNEENDVPDDPGPYGIMGWHEGDSAVYVYDRYDVWKLDPSTKIIPLNITKNGRVLKNSFRYVKLDPDERYFKMGQEIFFRKFNNSSKELSLEGWIFSPVSHYHFSILSEAQSSSAFLIKAKNQRKYIYSEENYTESPNLHFADPDTLMSYTREQEFYLANREIFSNLNPQQSQYNWGTAELFKWKTFDGKSSTGILYKPEDFDSTKKYPMIVYFYEKLSDGLYNYNAPAPTPSRLNISFFVSRGYLVFAPDISYTKGHPGKDAYNYIVSGTQALTKKKWVDAKNIGLQGQSWGGYQVAYLITATTMFKAAWAGAPVVNMFSAYGGIRWEAGVNRQFQYEKGQSRIGASPWERPDLYIENSPFFHLQKVTTPLVIMSNDADGAVPWYQGIEFFTAMRRLGKKVWLLSYNGEAHNLVERRNRKDIQVREQEYFDWLLKGEKPAKWITEGVPAVKKGKDWGLEIID
jgi:dienelactone hydrolase